MMNPEQQSGLSERRQLHILLVDDDADFVDLIAKELTETHSQKTTIARSGREAVKLLEQSVGRYDIILLDYNMKDMNGLDVLRWMQSHEIETPVIMLTGVGTEELAVDAMKLGAYDYLRKEHVDLQHLEVLLQATYERHLFRVTKAMEEESLREASLGDEATEHMRDVVNAISQTIDISLKGIAEEMRLSEASLQRLPESKRKAAQQVLNDLQRQVKVLESGLKGFLKLYSLVYAHHAWNEEIQQIKREFFENTKQMKVEKGRRPQ